MMPALHPNEGEKKVGEALVLLGEGLSSFYVPFHPAPSRSIGTSSNVVSELVG